MERARASQGVQMVLLLFIVGVAAWVVGWRWFDASGTVTLVLLAATAAAVALELVVLRDDPRKKLR